MKKSPEDIAEIVRRMFPNSNKLQKVEPESRVEKEVFLFKTEVDKDRFNTLVDNQWEMELHKDKGFVKTYSDIQKEVFEKYFKDK